MSSATTTPSADAAAPKKSKLPIIIALVLLLAGGGGGGYFFFVKRAGAATKEGHKEKAAKGEEEDEEHGADGEEGEEDAKEHDAKSAKKSEDSKSALPDDSKVKNVIELQPFIVNLADPGEARYLRLTVNVGVGDSEGEEGGGEEGGKADPLFTTRIRNAMLAVLTSKTSDEVLTAEGKVALRKELLKSARKVSSHPKVYAIYITDFIVQL